MRNKFFLLLILLFFLKTVKAQDKTNRSLLGVKSNSTVFIKGTSTLHDWESAVENIDTKLTINNLNGLHIEALIVQIEVRSIKSGKKAMDKLIHKTLKAKKHPIITFLFNKGEVITKNKNYLDIKLIGNLTISGVTKNISVITKVNKLEKTIVLKGKHTLKMTDFGITPPKVFLGIIKTGDEITVEFNLTFE